MSVVRREAEAATDAALERIRAMDRRLRSREVDRNDRGATSRSAGAALRSLIGSIDRDLMESDLSPSCRLASVWERVKAFDVYADFDAGAGDVGSIELNQDAAALFVKSVRRCTTLEPPPEWQKAIRHVEPVSGKSLFLSMAGDIPRGFATAHASEGRLRLVFDRREPSPDDASSLGRIEANRLTWEGKETEEVETPFWLRKGSEILVSSFEGLHVLVPTEWNRPGPILVLERRTGKVRWTTPSWGNGEVGTWRGPGIRGAKWLAVNRREVGVFGVTEFGIHIETFKVADGAPLLRFSSSYWDPTLWNAANWVVAYRRG